MIVAFVYRVLARSMKVRKRSCLKVVVTILVSLPGIRL